MSRRGTTLVELIAVLVLTALLAGIGGLVLAQVAQRYLVERDAAAAYQKLEVALARLTRELDWADWTTLAVSDGGRTLTWTSRHPDRVGDGSQTLTWNGVAGSDLQLAGNALLDDVDSFTTAGTVASGNLEVALRVGGAAATFRVRAIRDAP